MVSMLVGRYNVVHYPLFLQLRHKLLHRLKRTHECRRGHNQLLVYFSGQFMPPLGWRACVMK